MHKFQLMGGNLAQCLRLDADLLTMGKIVEPLLEQWGVRDLIGVPAGTDLVRVMKDSLQFHPAVLALAGVAPENAVVVDDDPEQVRRARALGARGVWVDAGIRVSGGAGGDVADAVISNIAELPDALRGIG